MKLLVLGATGGTGVQIVSQAMEQGHEVTAFVRDPVRLPIQRAGLRVVTGSVTEPGTALTAAVRGQDAVISALGMGNSLKSGNLISRSMPVIVAAMEREAVRRLIFVSALGVGDTRRDVPLLLRVMHRLLLADIFSDKKSGEDYLRRSGLNWTIVHPSILTDGPRTSEYRAGERLALRGLPRISRADVADFCLRQLREPAYLGKDVLLSS